ncbi:Uncharacterized protein Rs2_03021 [Raphanus sativus]|nr:Uncharacterized protein Rs2_03021 [Raphanus sativus]
MFAGTKNLSVYVDGREPRTLPYVVLQKIAIKTCCVKHLLLLEIQVDDPLTSVRNLFKSPSSKNPLKSQPNQERGRRNNTVKNKFEHDKQRDLDVLFETKDVHCRIPMSA